ncbi:MAG: anaerobic ribonucleoside-triphosphate reductase, partial [Bacilli bacterium]
FVLKPEHVHAHDNGDIHIHDMDFLNMGTLTCCQIRLDKLFKDGFSTGHGFLREPNSIMSYGALAAIAIQSDQNDQHGGQSIPFFDYDMAKGVYKTFKKTYIDNLSKGLELLSNIVECERLKEIVSSVEEETGIQVSLNKSDEYIDKESKKLIKTFNIDKEVVNKIQEFAYKESYKETDRQTYQSMEGFIHNLNTMHSR